MCALPGLNHESLQALRGRSARRLAYGAACRRGGDRMNHFITTRTLALSLHSFRKVAQPTCIKRSHRGVCQIEHAALDDRSRQ